MEKNISVFELSPGMKLSKPVYVEGTHIILINKDATLDASNINMLQQLGIESVFIHEGAKGPGGLRQPCAAEKKDGPEQSSASRPSPASADAPVQPAGKILVVDDEPEITQYIRDVLENSGYQVVCANSAGAAWDVLTQDESVDTVFLDLMMPDVGGLELLKRVRAEIKRDINAVIVTAKKSMQDIILAKELGISGYITKPFDPGKLVVIANQATSEKKTI